MDTPFRKIARLMVKRSRKGQSLIIIAFAAIALIAFVGIATDVALMFVRYSTLRRAVDAAAIAAAGQVRKGLDYNSLMAVAHQYIQVHGLNATSVKVETCETEVNDYLSHAPGNGYSEHPGVPFDPTNTITAHSTGTKAQEAIWDLTQNKDQLCKLTPQKLVRVSAQIASQTTFLSLLGFGTVTLQTSSVSQTAELDVAIVLNSSRSEALDTYTDQVAKNSGGNYIYPSQCYNMVPTGNALTGSGEEECNNSYALMNFQDFTNPPPTSLSQAQGGLTGIWGVGTADPTGPYSTNYPTYPGLRAIPYDGAHGQGDILTAANQPCKSDGALACQAFNTATLDAWNKTALFYPGGTTVPIIRPECWYEPKVSASSYPTLPFGPETHKKSDYAWAGCCNDPTVQSDNQLGTSSFDPWDYDPNNSGATYGAAPGNHAFNGDPYWYVYDNESEGFKESVIQTTGYNTIDYSGTSHPSAKVIAGGVWRNDTRGITGDGNYSDLICRPFKDVRDAARRFITRLNFAGGDRVVLVTFASSAKVYSPYGQNTLPIISDMGTAIQTLNMQVGVELNPSHRQQGCKTAGNGVDVKDWGNLDTNKTAYFNGDQYYVNVPYDPPISAPTNYWAQTQCVDTNSGAGIAAASNALVDPRYIRREAVWVMVVLSDGYPDRTPPIGEGDVGANQQDLNNIYQLPNPNHDGVSYNNNGNDPCTNVPGGSADPMWNWCCNASPNYGKQPQYCADVTNPDLKWGWRNNDPLLSNYGQVTIASDAAASQPGPMFSFGFCPQWTWDTTAQDPDVSSNFYSLSPHPQCTGNDPDARHFCMDKDGNINPTAAAQASAYQCDPQYDPLDYARDRVDFAALGSYTKTQKGNFIAMYSIFFAHSNTTTLGEFILGVKFARYIADAGDNGIIDNPIQRWYRDSRDGASLDPLIPNSGVNPPPTGGYGMVSGMTTTKSGTVSTVVTNPSPQGLTNQPLLPFYSATNPFWSNTNTYNYDITADPCAQYDYFYYGGSSPNAQGDTFLSEGTNQAAYDQRAETSCGQYYFANGPATLRAAFQSIASRLFTRLTG